MMSSKRFFDLFWSVVGLAVLAPLLVVIAVVIRLDSQGPVLFRQQRIGRDGREFPLFKFRTMTHGADMKGALLTIAGDPRITYVGRFLRETKMDEIPQLFNVLLGHMSFVGPRPEVPKYVYLYTPEQRKVLRLVPGITDPASIKFSRENELLSLSTDPEGLYVSSIMSEKIKLNLEYARSATVWTDVKVILDTIIRLLYDNFRPGRAGLPG